METMNTSAAKTLILDTALSLADQPPVETMSTIDSSIFDTAARSSSGEETEDKAFRCLPGVSRPGRTDRSLERGYSGKANRSRSPVNIASRQAREFSRRMDPNAMLPAVFLER